MLSSVFALSTWLAQVFQGFIGKSGSEPVLLALFGLGLFLIASRVRHATSRLAVQRKLEISAPAIGSTGRVDYATFVHLHTARSAASMEIAKQAVPSWRTVHAAPTGNLLDAGYGDMSSRA
jgi:hypothetical protein